MGMNRRGQWVGKPGRAKNKQRMKKNGMAETRKRRAAAKKGAKTRAANKAKAKALKQSWTKAGITDGTKVKWKEAAHAPKEPVTEVLGYATVAVAGYGWDNFPQSIRLCCENIKRENLGKVKAAAGDKSSPGYCRCRNNPENYVIVQLVKEPGQ